MFSMLTYLEELAARLDTLPKAAKLLFASWAAERVLSQGRKALEERVGGETTDWLEATLAQLKASATSQQLLDEKALKYWRDTSANLDWADTGDDRESTHADFLAAETVEAIMRALEVGLTGSSDSAAHAAERVLNCVDFELQMLRDVTEPSEHPLFQEELRLQSEKLDQLRRQTLAG